MKMNKIAMGVTALALMGTMVLQVWAEDAGKTGTTVINANVESTYTLTIPAKTEIVFNETSTNLNGTLKVKGNVLPSQKIVVLAEAQAFHNDVQNKDLPYMLIDRATGQEFSTDTWDEDTLRAGLTDGQGKEIQLSIDITEDDWNKAEAGTYAGSIVFKASMQEQAGE